ncbi:hypothetical protein M413DRAFT_284856 [Hebeloma cylindrosporum]|uniref:Uncharacterized protein n=1 Tax=Hebeloma cylindrosporum TaxID=76867 RepID=A0A0C3BZD1_HEBCY|nr:hypothetical protein M413DRAFT_284856 [Hebeloma cylindrosporum h7]
MFLSFKLTWVLVENQRWTLGNYIPIPLMFVWIQHPARCIHRAKLITLERLRWHPPFLKNNWTRQQAISPHVLDKPSRMVHGLLSESSDGARDHPRLTITPVSQSLYPPHMPRV